MMKQKKFHKVKFVCSMDECIIVRIYFVCFNIDFISFIRTGAIFHVDDEEAEIAFKNAVLRENMYNSFELKPIIKQIDSYDSFEAERLGNENQLSIVENCCPHFRKAI